MSDVLDTIKLLEEAHAKSTQSKWIADSGSVAIGDTGEYDPYWAVRVVRGKNRNLMHMVASEEENDANMNFVVAAHNMQPKLIAELKRLLEVEAKLPLTADGVRVVPGMPLWGIHAGRVVPYGECDPSADGTVIDGELLQTAASELYSSPAAAQAAVSAK